MKKYLIQVKTHDDEYSVLRTEQEIFEMINFLKFNNELYKIYDITDFDEVKKINL